MANRATRPRVTSFAPRCLVDDLERSMTCYRKLGFTSGEPWGGFYAIGKLDGLERHLEEAPQNGAERQDRRDHEHLDAAAGVDGIDAVGSAGRAGGARVLDAGPPREQLGSTRMFRRLSVTCSVLGLTLLAHSPSRAQASRPVPMPEYHRAVQLRALEVERTLLLAMADSMPEALYHDHATPIQRDFAAQIMHAAEGPSLVISEYLHGPPPSLPDSTAAANTRAGLRAYINASYNYATALLRDEAPRSRARLFRFWNGSMMPRWQLWDEIHQHTMWTAGQVVANFRNHGMAPPGFGFF